VKKTYNINLELISLQYFKEILQERELIPSRRILKEDIDDNFQKLANSKVGNLHELIKNLNTSEKIRSFSKVSGLSEQYLKILRREAASYTPNPINLRNFPEINLTTINELEKIGIKNTKHLFDTVQMNSDFIEKISSSDKMSEEIKELISLSDLVRLYGVGPVFAKMIYKIGIKSVNEFTTYSGEDFIRIYEKETNKKADFSIHDINFSLELANIISSIES